MHRYFALVEAGAITLVRSDLITRLTPAVHGALRANGLVRAGRPARAWDCDDRRRHCGREVVDAAPGRPKPFVALCEGAYHGDDPCPGVALGAEEIAQESLGLKELVQLLQRLYRLDPSVIPERIGRDPVPLGVGRPEGEAGAARDVFLAPAPADRAIAPFLALRERAPRPTLVLVPTAQRVPAETVTRYAPGAHVEVEALEDVVVIREGAIVRMPRLRLVVAAPAPALQPAAEVKPARPPGIAAMIGATEFGQIRITAVDGHTLRIACGKKAIRRTYLDLGLHAGNTRETTKKWNILMAACQGHGVFRWKPFGAMGAVSQQMSLLRAKLCDAFGLDDDPFHEFHTVHGWKTKFFASSEIDGDES